MHNVLLVALGGAAGSAARYLVTSLAALAGAAPRFPLGTLVVNAAGCLAVGAFMGAAQSRDWLHGPARPLVVTGFLGGFTTFSAFGWETWALVQQRAAGAAALNAALQLALGLLAVWAGLRLGAAIPR